MGISEFLSQGMVVAGILAAGIAATQSLNDSNNNKQKRNDNQVGNDDDTTKKSLEVSQEFEDRSAELQKEDVERQVSTTSQGRPDSTDTAVEDLSSQQEILEPIQDYMSCQDTLASQQPLDEDDYGNIYEDDYSEVQAEMPLIGSVDIEPGLSGEQELQQNDVLNQSSMEQTITSSRPDSQSQELSQEENLILQDEQFSKDDLLQGDPNVVTNIETIQGKPIDANESYNAIDKSTNVDSESQVQQQMEYPIDGGIDRSEIVSESATSAAELQQTARQESEPTIQQQSPQVKILADVFYTEAELRSKDLSFTQATETTSSLPEYENLVEQSEIQEQQISERSMQEASNQSPEAIESTPDILPQSDTEGEDIQDLEAVENNASTNLPLSSQSMDKVPSPVEELTKSEQVADEKFPELFVSSNDPSQAASLPKKEVQSFQLSDIDTPTTLSETSSFSGDTGQQGPVDDDVTSPISAIELTPKYAAQPDTESTQLLSSTTAQQDEQLEIPSVTQESSYGNPQSKISEQPQSQAVQPEGMESTPYSKEVDSIFEAFPEAQAEDAARQLPLAQKEDVLSQQDTSKLSMEMPILEEGRSTGSGSQSAEQIIEQTSIKEDEILTRMSQEEDSDVLDTFYDDQSNQVLPNQSTYSSENQQALDAPIHVDGAQQKQESIDGSQTTIPEEYLQSFIKEDYYQVTDPDFISQGADDPKAVSDDTQFVSQDLKDKEQQQPTANEPEQIILEQQMYYFDQEDGQNVQGSSQQTSEDETGTTQEQSQNIPTQEFLQTSQIINMLKRLEELFSQSPALEQPVKQGSSSSEIPDSLQEQEFVKNSDRQDISETQKQKDKRTPELVGAASLVLGGGDGGDGSNGDYNGGSGGAGGNGGNGDDAFFSNSDDEWSGLWLLYCLLYLTTLPICLWIHDKLFADPAINSLAEVSSNIQQYHGEDSEESHDVVSPQLPFEEVTVEWSEQEKPEVTQYLHLMRQKDLKILKEKVEEEDVGMNIEELGSWGVMWRTVVPAMAAIGLFVIGKKGDDGDNKEGKGLTRGLSPLSNDGQNTTFSQVAVEEKSLTPQNIVHYTQEAARLTEHTHMLKAEIKAHESTIMIRNEEVEYLRLELDQAQQDLQKSQQQIQETSQKLNKAEAELSVLQTEIEQEHSKGMHASQTIEMLQKEIADKSQYIVTLQEYLEQQLQESQLALSEYNYTNVQLQTKVTELQQAMSLMKLKEQQQQQCQESMMEKHFQLVYQIRQNLLDKLNLNPEGEVPEDIEDLSKQVVDQLSGIRQLQDDYAASTVEVRRLTRKRQEYEALLKDKDQESNELKNELETVQKMLGLLKREYCSKSNQLTQAQSKQVDLHRQLERSTQELDYLNGVCQDMSAFLDEKQKVLKEKQDLEQQLRAKETEVVRLEYEQGYANEIMQALNDNLAERSEDMAEVDNSVDNLRRKNQTLHRKLAELSKAKNLAKQLKSENAKLSERKGELERMLTNKQNQSDRLKAEKETSDQLLAAYKGRDQRSNDEIQRKLEDIREVNVLIRKLQRQLSNPRSLSFLTEQEKQELGEKVKDKELELDSLLADVEQILKERQSVMSQIDELKADNAKLYSRMRNMSNSLVDRVSRSQSFIEGQRRQPARSVTSMNLASKVIEAEMLNESSQKLDLSKRLSRKPVKRSSQSSLKSLPSVLEH